MSPPLTTESTEGTEFLCSLCALWLVNSALARCPGSTGRRRPCLGKILGFLAKLPHDVHALERSKGQIHRDEVCFFDYRLGAQ